MFFYIDESGHTGSNLFDLSQPTLYYGLLYSRLDLDTVAETPLSRLRNQLGVSRLHAAELGNGRLVSIVNEIVNIQKNCDLKFDLYFVRKMDLAVISFFDQVFDQGVNPAMTHTGYWTFLRYSLLLKVASLFDIETLKDAWSARNDLDESSATARLVEVCSKLRGRLDSMSDVRAQQIIRDTLQWAENHPQEIHYSVNHKSDQLNVSPNLIGFQSIMFGIAARLKENALQASGIVVDQQSEFNKPQQVLSQFFASLRSVPPFVFGLGLPDVDFGGMPDLPISFASSTTSAGLELVDIYLWIAKRFIEGQTLAPELLSILQSPFHQGYTNEISIDAIADRLVKQLNELPEFTKEEMEKAKELWTIDEDRRLRAIRGE